MPITCPAVTACKIDSIVFVRLRVPVGAGKKSHASRQILRVHLKNLDSLPIAAERAPCSGIAACEWLLNKMIDARAVAVPPGLDGILLQSRDPALTIGPVLFDITQFAQTAPIIVEKGREIYKHLVPGAPLEPEQGTSLLSQDLNTTNNMNTTTNNKTTTNTLNANAKMRIQQQVQFNPKW